MVRRIQTADKQIRYTLTYKKVKNINLRIQRDGSVVVSAPVYTKPERIDAFVRSKAGWIQKHQATLLALRQRALWPETLDNGESIRLFGRSCTLLVNRDDRESVVFEQDRLILNTRDPENTVHKQEQIGRWVRKIMKERCRVSSQKIFQCFQKNTVPEAEIRLRKMTSRWGSCQPFKGIITVNTALIQAPDTCLDYVMLHEYCHFVHPDHSPDFYRLLTAMMPDWKTRKAWLESAVFLK